MKSIISITALLTTLSLFSFNAMAAVAAGTVVQVSSETIIVADELVRGQTILTATEESTRDNINFQPSTLIFVSGASSQSNVILMGFGDNSQLMATPDQAVLTISGKLVKVSRLVPGKDQLVDASGNAVNINFLSQGSFAGRIVDFAPESNKVTENLYLANGILLGSYKISMHLSQSKKIEAFVGQVLDF